MFKLYLKSVLKIKLDCFYFFYFFYMIFEFCVFSFLFIRHLSYLSFFFLFFFFLSIILSSTSFTPFLGCIFPIILQFITIHTSILKLKKKNTHKFHTCHRRYKRQASNQQNKVWEKPYLGKKERKVRGCWIYVRGDMSIVGDGTYVDASVKSDQMQFISQHTNP